MKTKQIKNNEIKAMSGIKKVTEKTAANHLINEHSDAALFFDKVKEVGDKYHNRDIEQRLIEQKYLNKIRYTNILMLVILMLGTFAIVSLIINYCNGNI